jgi:negative regulator of flagellin synthesis FlgM
LDVSTKIGGFQNRPVQVSTDKAVATARDGQKSSAGTVAAGNSVRITDQARQLATLEHALQGMPIVNESRVAEIRDAIEQGRYEVVPERIADRLMRMDRDLGAVEK